VLMPVFREREFELRDVAEIRGLWHLLCHGESVASVVVMLGAWTLALAFAYVLLVWAFGRIARTASTTRGAWVGAALLQVCVLGSMAYASSTPQPRSAWHPSMFAVTVEQAWRAFRIAIDPSLVDAPILARITEAADVMDRAPGNLGKLGGADVHFVILESYGRVAQRHPDLAPHLRAVHDELAVPLHVAGFQVASSTCKPAIRGGASWLAHAQLFTSVLVDSQRAWELVLASRCVPLPKRFAAAGYRTIEVAPAMHIHWPEGAAFYGFTDEVTQIELGYTGTRYHWGLMPDQFALHHLLERYIEPATQPLFTSFVSVTNHVPFRSVPPYVANWQIDGQTFAGAPRVVHDVPWSGVTEPSVVLPAYRDTLEYSLRTIVGFVCRLKRPSLVIVLGDHQPPFCNSIEPPDPTYDVVIHVFGNRAELMAPIMAAGGFVQGFEIPADREAFDLSLLAPALLNVYAK
jgi:hypothetical protein